MTLVNKKLGLALAGIGVFYLGASCGAMVQFDLSYRRAAKGA